MEQVESEKQLHKLMEIFRDFRRNEISDQDVLFVSEHWSEPVRVHRILLALRSGYFGRLFKWQRANMGASKIVFPIKGFSRETVQKVIDFMYGEKLENSEEIERFARYYEIEGAVESSGCIGSSKMSEDEIDDESEVQNREKLKQKWMKKKQKIDPQSIARKSATEILNDIIADDVRYNIRNRNKRVPLVNCSMNIDGQKFMSGFMESERDARKLVATKVLFKIFDIDKLGDLCDLSKTQNNLVDQVFEEAKTSDAKYLVAAEVLNEELELLRLLANRFQHLVLKKYDEITRNLSWENRPFMVIAAIIMTDEANPEHHQVLTFGTGNRFVALQNLKSDGTRIVDCHAEILARRGLVRQLFSDFLDSNREKVYFCDEPDSDTGKYKLKPNLKFHLYISYVPCGDSRVRRGMTRETENCLPAGTLRLKGEAALTFRKDADRKYETYSMSCSDKIMRWNVLGVQGALLNRFVEPIYLSSIIVGDSFDKHNFYGASIGRIETHLSPGDLPKGFKVNKPALVEASAVRNPPNFSSSPVGHSLSWSFSFRDVEVINSSTGAISAFGSIEPRFNTDPLSKEKNTEWSRISKKGIFIRFLGSSHGLQECSDSTSRTLNYSTFKKASQDYQMVKQIFIKACDKSGIGKWVEKPSDLNDFYISNKNCTTHAFYKKTT